MARARPVSWARILGVGLVAAFIASVATVHAGAGAEPRSAPTTRLPRAQASGPDAARVIAQAPAKKEPTKKPAPKSAEKKKAAPRKEPRAEPHELKGIDASGVWRGETEVFSADQLVRLEPILFASTCKDEKAGCLYLENGRPGSEASFTFRLIPWKVSKHRGFLVRNDRCAPGGCDEGLFVLVEGRWRLVIETFGVLERASSTTLGFNDLRFKPRGQAPVRLVWDGRGYREANSAD